MKFDKATEEYMKNKPSWYVTTMVKCKKCELFYKASLGHKCEEHK